MFNKSPVKKSPPKIQQNPNKEPVPRKKRSDAKNDVKIPMTLQQRQIIKQLAKRHRISMTTYCSDLLALFLRRKTEYRLVEYSSADKKSVHAKLSSSDYDILYEYSIKWDCSLRQAAHRIMMTAIPIESGGIGHESL
jgi:hypothetical protein